jgi:hypothetical protein
VYLIPGLSEVEAQLKHLRLQQVAMEKEEDEEGAVDSSHALEVEQAERFRRGSITGEWLRRDAPPPSTTPLRSSLSSHKSPSKAWARRRVPRKSPEQEAAEAQVRMQATQYARAFDTQAPQEQVRLAREIEEAVTPGRTRRATAAAGDAEGRVRISATAVPVLATPSGGAPSLGAGPLESPVLSVRLRSLAEIMEEDPAYVYAVSGARN